MHSLHQSTVHWEHRGELATLYYHDKVEVIGATDLTVNRPLTWQELSAPVIHPHSSILITCYWRVNDYIWLAFQNQSHDEYGNISNEWHLWFWFASCSVGYDNNSLLIKWLHEIFPSLTTVLTPRQNISISYFIWNTLTPSKENIHAELFSHGASIYQQGGTWNRLHRDGVLNL